MLGFVAGMHAGNYDISKVFIDALYKIVDSKDASEAEKFLLDLDAFASKHSVDFVVALSEEEIQATETMKIPLHNPKKGEMNSSYYIRNMEISIDAITKIASIFLVKNRSIFIKCKNHCIKGFCFLSKSAIIMEDVSVEISRHLCG